MPQEGNAESDTEQDVAGETEESDEGAKRAKRAKLDLPTEPETKNDSDDDDADTGQICPICMDMWSNAGEHRLCSLRCGHLFGHNCVLKWLQVGCTGGNRRCPQCNRKAAVKDIRILYARKVSATDTAELEKLKKELTEVTMEKNRLEMEVSKCHLRQKLYDQQLASMASRMAELERQQTDMSLRLNESVSRSATHKFYLEKTLEISRDGGCRVLDYNPWESCIAVSQKSANALFSGYGVRKINTEMMQAGPYILLHNQAIRDLSFHPSQQSLLLSVSFDKTVKIVDIHNNVVVHGYPVDSQLWSGCWSAENSNILLVGGQNGSITEFDIRQTTGAVATHASPNDRSPVVSLATVPANSAGGMSRGGFIAAHLNTCYAYEHKDPSLWSTKQMFLEGPFISVRYDEKNHHALISSRPNARIPNARHTVFTLEQGNEEALVCNIIHTFNGGNSQQMLSRPCHINVGDDTFIAAHQESTKSIPLWSISSGKQMYSLPVSDPVLDMCSFQAKDNIFLATLSSTKFRLYNHS